MSPPLTKVLLIGAGGRLGTHLLQAFVSDPTFTVSVLARSSSSSVSNLPSHVKVFRTGDDYPVTDLNAAFAGQDAVVSAIATASIAQQKRIIDAAVEAGAKRFVVSEFGSDSLNDNAMALMQYVLDPKRQTVEYLRAKEKEGLSWSAFVTGPFFELALLGGFLGYNIKNRSAALYKGGDAKFSTTKLASISLAVKNSLLKPDQTANKYLYINSFNVTASEVLAALEKASGSKWDVTWVDPEESKNLGSEKIAKGDLTGQPLLIRYICFMGGHGANYAEYRETANKLLGLPEDDFEESIADVLKAAG